MMTKLRTACVLLATLTLFPAAAGAEIAVYTSHARIPFVEEWGLARFDIPLTGTSSRIGAGGLMFDFDFDAGGVLYSSDGEDLHTVNLTTGEQTEIGQFDQGGVTSSLAFAPDGTLYGIRQNFLVTIDPATAATTFVDSTDRVIQAIDFGPDGTLYGVRSDGLYTIDPATAQIIDHLVETSFPDFQAFDGLDYGVDGIIRAVGTEDDNGAVGRLYAFDPSAGTMTTIGDTTEIGVNAIASIPEPATAALLLAAAALTTTHRTRRRRSC